jgi:predicted methyltransferase
MSKSNLTALTLSHEFMARHVGAGDFCIDVTAGNGGDTAFLCSLVGESGRVLALDIQESAVNSTRALLHEKGYANVGEVVRDSHANIAAHAEPGTVACICFNLGWLPGGDHGVHTETESTIEAVKQSLALLKPGGVLSICIYYGRDCGFGERDALLDYLAAVDFRCYTVFVGSFHNRPTNPPIPVFVIRDE